MRSDTYAYTHKGGREINEDMLMYEEEREKAEWVLADGLGGHTCGEIASTIGVKAAMDVLKEAKLVSKDVVRDAIEKSNSKLIEVQDSTPHTKNMRSTIVVALADAEKLIWGSIGDSRIYLFRDGEILTQSKDHTVSYKAYLSGEIMYEDIRHHEDKGRLLRVLGNDKECRVDMGDDYIYLKSGDAFLLCSDGFWEYVYEMEMIIDLQKSRTPKEWINYMLKRHLKRVNQNHDNYSLIGVFIK